MARIMVVEDEGVVAVDIKSQLESLGYTICSLAMTGEEAIDMVESDQPDLVLMDIALAGELDGIEAAAQIKLGFNIPVVYLTAYANNEIMDRAKLTEPFGYLLKPFNPKELQATIEMALYKAKMDRERMVLLAEKEKLVKKLETALEDVKTLQGLIKICANCKNVHSDAGAWQRIEKYIQERSDAKFTHTLCPKCMKALYPDFDTSRD